MEEIKGRFVFPGNLKLPVEVIKNANLNDKRRKQLFEVLDRLKVRAMMCVTINKSSCTTVQLDRHRRLYIDYKDRNMNFWIFDDARGILTQQLTYKDCLSIEWQEKPILRGISKFSEKVLDKKDKENLLTQTFVHTAYDLKLSGIKPPKVRRHEMDDDFTLDI